MNTHQSSRPTAPRRGIGTIATVATLALFAAACGDDSESASSDGPQPVTLRYATSLVEDAVEHRGFELFLEELRETAPWIQFEYIGGPEAIPSLDVAESVQIGAIDFAPVCTCYLGHLVPEAEVFELSPYSPSEERENGVLEVLQEWHADRGLYLLGGSVSELSYAMNFGPNYTRLDIENLDLSGWLMRSAASAQPPLEAFNAEVVNITLAETYTAMDRGTIDGFAAGNVGMYELGLAEPIQAHLVAPLRDIRYPILFNPEVWNSLDPETQEALTTAVINLEGQLEEIFQDAVAEEQAKYVEDGKVLLEPSEEAKTEIRRRGIERSWDDLAGRSERTLELRERFEEAAGE